MPLINESLAFAIAAGTASPPFTYIDSGDRPLGEVTGTPVKIVKFVDERNRPRYGLVLAGHPFPDKYEQAASHQHDAEIFWRAGSP